LPDTVCLEKFGHALQAQRGQARKAGRKEKGRYEKENRGINRLAWKFLKGTFQSALFLL
jgi:hypothetical protein